MKRIKAKKTPWTQHIGATFTWPEDVEVVFPDGEVHDAYGARDRNGNSIDYIQAVGGQRDPHATKLWWRMA